MSGRFRVCEQGVSRYQIIDGHIILPGKASPSTEPWGLRRAHQKLRWFLDAK
jgi:hypothetical protein